MLDRETVAILVCPVTRQPLALADAPLIAKINGVIEAGKLLDQLGRLVKQPITEGLVRQDGKILYPVRDGIPVMLADEGIALEQIGCE
ncbi:MAG: hypothetical protein IT426_07390 [Pirellulales bacterium]|nr:hypothetical protein [Pirellulales bacterium]